MSVRMRIIQEYPAADAARFLELERGFAELERRRPDLPRGARFTPLASALPTNCLIWEADFASLDAARAALAAFAGDAEHERLAEAQRPLMRSVRIEFLEPV